MTVRNVPSYRYRKDVELDVPGFGSVTGDIAWGGNWFFLVKGESPIELSLRHLDELAVLTWSIRKTLERHGITGEHGEVIDHIELYGPPRDSTANSRNFVLCPGKSYDRSPCGTGTSAKIACLYEDGKLNENELWIQESITGSVFEAYVERHNSEAIPFIKGWAFVTSEADLVIDERDPFRWGIPA